jgi:hypothetical protein
MEKLLASLTNDIQEYEKEVNFSNSGAYMLVHVDICILIPFL